MLLRIDGREARALWLVVVAVSWACSAGELEPTAATPAPAASELAFEGFRRLVSDVDPSDPWREVKARAGDQYRNVLYDPATGEPVREWRSPLLRIPAGAWLDFGIALAEVGQRPVRVEFSVEAEPEGGVLFSRVVETTGAWQDARIDLGALSGHTLRLVFRSPEVAGTQPVWGDPVLSADPGDAASGAGPNLVLISLDTLRADHLGAYGYHRNTSPNFDRFAEEGLLFEQCIAPSSWTAPSHASVFTGHHPAVHEAGGPLGHRLHDRFSTLAEVARTQGYLTAAFTEGAAVAGQLGFHQGFDVYANGPHRIPPRAGTADETFARAAAWLERRVEAPFLLFLHTYEIHWPYRSPAPYARMFAEEGVSPIGDADAGDLRFIHGELSDAQKAAFTADYDAGIAYTDSVLGRFVERLRANGLLENTIVVIFSDHGEEFWEHGGVHHGFHLHDEVLHVPLLIRLAGASPPRGRIERQVALVDVFATVSRLLGLPVRRPAASLDLRPLWDPEGAHEAYAREVVLSELVQTSASWLFLATRTEGRKYVASTVYGKPPSPLYAVREHLGEAPLAAERRLVDHLLAGGRGVGAVEDDEERREMNLGVWEQLFDLAADSAESRDLALGATRGDALALERARLAAALDELAADAAEVGPRRDRLEPLGADEVAELRALGYVQ